MEKITGILKRLGRATTLDVAIRYSVIEIGDRVLTNIATTDGLATFLEDGLRQETPITLHITKTASVSVLVGLEIDGKTYYQKDYQSIGGAFTSLLAGAAFAFVSFVATAVIFGVLSGSLFNSKKDMGGFQLLLVFLSFPVGGYFGFKWFKKKFSRPAIFSTWEAQGAIAV